MIQFIMGFVLGGLLGIIIMSVLAARKEEE